MKRISNRFLLWFALIIFYILSSCFSCVEIARFENCTNDTLYICTSYYDDIDSIVNQLFPLYDEAKNNLDSTDVSLWNNYRRKKATEGKSKSFEAQKDWYIYPDSFCGILDPEYSLFTNSDTCYFFLIKWKDTKMNSWDEICRKRMYHRWVVTKSRKGKFEKKIKYPDSEEQ